MKKKVLVNVNVDADLSRATYYVRDMEDYAKQIEGAVKEFHDFIRDHRSMDWVTLNVNREYENQCSHCGMIWEVDSDGVPVCCDDAVNEHLIDNKEDI